MYPILCIIIKWSKTTSLPTGFTEQEPVNSILGGDRLLFSHPGASSTAPRWAEDRPYPLQCWMASLCFPFCLVFSIWLLAGYYACKSNNFKEKQKQVNGSTALLPTTSTTLRLLYQQTPFSSSLLLPQEITMTLFTKQLPKCQALKPFKWVFWLWGWGVVVGGCKIRICPSNDMNNNNSNLLKTA